MSISESSRENFTRIYTIADNLTARDVQRIMSAAEQWDNDAWDRAMTASYNVLRIHKLEPDWELVKDDISGLVKKRVTGVEQDLVWIVAVNAIFGLFLRDFIGKQNFTQQSYDTLTEPWVKTFGKVHPDDNVDIHILESNNSVARRFFSKWKKNH